MLELDSVDAYYGNSHVLHDLSMTVGDDETVALLGRNGAGKTTTIKSIMGIETTVVGTITFDGTPLTGLSPDEVFDEGISWIPQERRVFPLLTVDENLTLGGHDAGEAQRAEIYELFPRLENRLEQRAGTLSGGEQQMLAVARGLLSDPDLLLVDEPFEGLMPGLVTDLREVLTELTETTDMSILITSQKTDVVLQFVERALMIQNGSVEYEGAASDLRGDVELQEQYLGVGR